MPDLSRAFRSRPPQMPDFRKDLRKIRKALKETTADLQTARQELSAAKAELSREVVNSKDATRAEMVQLRAQMQSELGAIRQKVLDIDKNTKPTPRTPA